ncbi:MAG: hypothetical protein WAP03_21805 [Methylorubrum rhodinum]|uniref:hypothetical protein n=1 Tax=Methylorubrum rhodinum TaxID=29428 RepID=UPI003BAFBE58
MFKTWLAISVCIFSFPAVSLAEEKNNAIDNLASLVVASKWCDDYIIKKETIVDIVIAMKIDISNKSTKKLLEDKKAEYEKVMGEAGATAYCTYAYKVFGPGGDIPGLMMKK